MNTAGWIIWALFLGITVICGIAWRIWIFELGKGKRQEKDIMDFLMAYPRIFVLETLILIIFIFFPYRLNLLWIYPWVWYRVLKKIRKLP